MTKKKTKKIKETKCPRCEHNIDSALRINNGNNKHEVPEPGDLCICGYCHIGLAFTDSFTLRLATTKENALIWNEMCKTTLEEYSVEQKYSTATGR